MKIAIVCTVPDGGMAHFAVACFASASDLGEDVLLLLPEGSAVDVGAFKKAGEICQYALRKGFIETPRTAKSIQSLLCAFEPDAVWFIDETVTSSAVKKLRGGGDVVFVHDAKPHMSKMSIKTRLRFAYLLRRRKGELKHARQIVVMSFSAKKDVIANYPFIEKGKIAVLRLGATAPKCKACKPAEFEGFRDTGFFLFFGAMEKYKNVDGLVEAFVELLRRRPRAKLVLAGRGAVDEGTQHLIEGNPSSIVLLSRYIPDEELVYLMEHARAVMLPYREATQSGVLPISYSYSKPVVVSDVPGLVEFVEEGKTGLVVKSKDDLVAAMEILLDDEVASTMGLAGKDYVACELDFRSNVCSLIETQRDWALPEGGSR